MEANSVVQKPSNAQVSIVTYNGNMRPFRSRNSRCSVQWEGYRYPIFHFQYCKNLMYTIDRSVHWYPFRPSHQLPLVLQGHQDSKLDPPRVSLSQLTLTIVLKGKHQSPVFGILAISDSLCSVLLDSARQAQNSCHLDLFETKGCFLRQRRV